jgi:putative heme-binding domain-containing protein
MQTTLRLTLPFLLALLAPCLLTAQNPRQGVRNPLDRTEEVIAEGRRLFNNSCTVCHGIDGAAGDRGPAMAAQRRYLLRSDEELFHAIADGIPGTTMPPMGLPEQDAWKVVAFIQSLRARAIDVPVPGDQAAGAEIFWNAGRCGQCHVVNGRGGLIGPDLSNLGAEMSLKEIREALTVAKPYPPLGYRPISVITKDGRKIAGVTKNEHNFSVQILGDDNQLYLFTTEELQDIQYADRSLMPTNYDKTLSDKEFQDLLAFLSRLTRRQPGEEGSRRRRARD